MRVLDVNGTWHVGAAVEVEEELAALARKHAVCAVSLGDLHLLAVGEVHLVEMTLQRTHLGGGVISVAVAVEALEGCHHIVALLDLACLESLGVVQPQMIVAVTLCKPQKLSGAAWQEMRRSLRLNILRVGVLEDGLDELAIQSVVFVEAERVLSAVQDADVHLLVVVVPCDGGEIMFLRLAGLHHHIFAFLHVVDVQLHYVRRHACHRIFDVFRLSDTCRDIHKRIVCHHTLVHLIIGETAAVRRPEDTSVDGELVAVHRLSSNHVFRVLGHTNLFLAVGDVEVVPDGVSHPHSGLVEGHILRLNRK